MIALFLFILVNLMFHFMECPIEGSTCIFAFNMSHNRVVSLNLDQQLHVNAVRLKIECHVNFTDSIKESNKLLGFLRNVFTDIVAHRAMPTGN